jgi:hypothetical protein
MSKLDVTICVPAKKTVLAIAKALRGKILASSQPNHKCIICSFRDEKDRKKKLKILAEKFKIDKPKIRKNVLRIVSIPDKLDIDSYIKIVKKHGGMFDGDDYNLMTGKRRFWFYFGDSKIASMAIKKAKQGAKKLKKSSEKLSEKLSEKSSEKSSKKSSKKSRKKGSRKSRKARKSRKSRVRKSKGKSARRKGKKRSVK